MRLVALSSHVGDKAGNLLPKLLTVVPGQLHDQLVDALPRFPPTVTKVHCNRYETRVQSIIRNTGLEFQRRISGLLEMVRFEINIRFFLAHPSGFGFHFVPLPPPPEEPPSPCSLLKKT